MIISPGQCRMARAALQIGIRDIAAMAKVSPNTISRLERGENLNTSTLAVIRGAFEREGVIFIGAGEESPGGGEGVRLAFSNEQQES